MAVCLIHRYRGLAVLVRSYRSPFTVRYQSNTGGPDDYLHLRLRPHWSLINLV